jgi:hypothetical protein
MAKVESSWRNNVASFFFGVALVCIYVILHNTRPLPTERPERMGAFLADVVFVAIPSIIGTFFTC